MPQTLFLESPTLKKPLVLDLTQGATALATRFKKNPLVIKEVSRAVWILVPIFHSSKLANASLGRRLQRRYYLQVCRLVFQCWIGIRKLTLANWLHSVEGQIVSGLKYLQVVKRAGLSRKSGSG